MDLGGEDQPMCDKITLQTHLCGAGGLSKCNHSHLIRATGRPFHCTETTRHTQTIETMCACACLAACGRTADEDIVIDDELFSFSYMCWSKTAMTVVVNNCHENWESWSLMVQWNSSFKRWPFANYIYNYMIIRLNLATSILLAVLF